MSFTLGTVKTGLTSIFGWMKFGLFIIKKNYFNMVNLVFVYILTQFCILMMSHWFYFYSFYFYKHKNKLWFYHHPKFGILIDIFNKLLISVAYNCSFIFYLPSPLPSPICTLYSVHFLASAKTKAGSNRFVSSFEELICYASTVMLESTETANNQKFRNTIVSKTMDRRY